jgi:hypothetical protein
LSFSYQPSGYWAINFWPKSYWPEKVSVIIFADSQPVTAYSYGSIFLHEPITGENAWLSAGFPITNSIASLLPDWVKTGDDGALILKFTITGSDSIIPARSIENKEYGPGLIQSPYSGSEGPEQIISVITGVVNG